MERISITLRVQADDLDPDQITDAVGLIPTKSFRKGDRVGTHGRAAFERRSYGHWSHMVEIADALLFDACVRELLKHLPDGFTSMIRQQKGAVDLFVGVFGVVDQASLTIEADVLRELGEHGVSIMFDLYT